MVNMTAILLPQSFFKKTTYLPLQFVQEENIHGQSFERRAYYFFQSYWVSSIPTGRVLIVTLQYFANG